jgi:hypothetical protein
LLWTAAREHGKWHRISSTTRTLRTATRRDKTAIHNVRIRDPAQDSTQSVLQNARRAPAARPAVDIRPKCPRHALCAMPGQMYYGPRILSAPAGCMKQRRARHSYPFPVMLRSIGDRLHAPHWPPKAGNHLRTHVSLHSGTLSDTWRDTSLSASSVHCSASVWQPTASLLIGVQTITSERPQCKDSEVHCMCA